MRYTGKWPVQGMTPTDIAQERVRASDYIQVRGTARMPRPPLGLIIAPAPRGVLVTWNLPVLHADITGWRIYKNDESTLYGQINDPGVRQEFVETTAGSPSVVTNVFVSSINALGVESPKIQIQGKASTESGAPTMPTVPPGFNTGGSGGGNTSGGRKVV